MKAIARSAALGATALIAVLAFGATTASAQNDCLRGKTRCVNKKMAGLLTCHIKAEKASLVPDATCLSKVYAKFDGGTKGTEASCFRKLELKEDPLVPRTMCVTHGDRVAQDAKVDAFVLDVVQELDPGYPAPTLNLCSAGKKKCVFKKAEYLLKCHERCQWDPPVQCGAVLDTCTAKALARYDGGTKGPEASCFRKLEIKYGGGCLTTGDEFTLEDKVDAFITDVLQELENTAPPTPTPTVASTPTPCATATPGGSCPTQVEIGVKGDGTETDLDAGWSGMMHDSHTGSMGRLTLQVSGCAGTEPPTCGVCTTSGPIANAGGAAFNNQRCVGDTAIQCATDGDCGGSGPCHFFFGGPLALSAGGLPLCVTNEIVQPVTGTVDVEAGATRASVQLLWRLHPGPTLDKPCPNCRSNMCIGGLNQYAPCAVGSECPGGTCQAAFRCDSGLHASDACTVNSQSPTFGDWSFDCPLDPDAAIGIVPVPLDYTTGTQTWSLGGGSPSCTHPGYTEFKCFCDTCDNENAEPCTGVGQCSTSCLGGTNNGVTCADPSECPGGTCVGGICGGRRCRGGANDGTPCSTGTQCPGGGCYTSSGVATKTNDCSDAVCTPSPSDTDSSNEGVCAAGPIEYFCGPHATFRSCFSDPECTVSNRCVGGSHNGALGCTVEAQCPGGVCEIQSCSGEKFRECFTDNGVIGTHCLGGTNAREPCGTLTDCSDQSAGTFCGGGSVTATGAPYYPTCNGTGTVATLFCMAPTKSAAVSAVLGLPGLGRVTLPTTLSFN